MAPGAYPKQAQAPNAALFLLGRLQALPTNIKLGRKSLTHMHTLAYYTTELITTVKKFYSVLVYTTKHYGFVMYVFRNKLKCLSLNTRLGWKGLPGTNTLAYYENRKFYDTGPWGLYYKTLRIRNVLFP